MRKAYIFKRLTETVKHFAVLMLITLMAAGNLFADQVTFVFSAAGLESGQVLPAGNINDVISYSGEKQNASTDGPKYYSTGGTLRFYADGTSGNGNALTLTPAFGYQITGLVINATEDYAPNVGYSVNGDEAVIITADSNYVYTISDIEASTSLKFYNAGTSQLRITSITVFYTTADVPAVAAPTFSQESGVQLFSFNLSLSCPTPGANIYYAFNDEEYVLYQQSVSITSTTTVHAYAVLGEDTSVVVHAAYQLPQYVNLDQFKQGVPGDLYMIYQSYTKLNFVFRDGRNLYFQAQAGTYGTGYGLLVYDNNPSVITTEFLEGETPAGLVGTLSFYNGIPELIPVMNVEKSALSQPHVVAPTEVTLAELMANPSKYISDLVILRDGTFAAGSFNTSSKTGVNFVQGTDTITIYNNFKKVTATFEGGEVGTVIGLVGMYNGVPQIYPRGNSDIIRPTVPYTCTFEDLDQNAWKRVNNAALVENNWHIGDANGLFDNNKLFVSGGSAMLSNTYVNQPTVVHAYIDITLPDADVLLNFDCRVVGNAQDFLQVSVMDENPALNVLPENYLARFYGLDEFTNLTVLIPASYAGNKKVVFTWRNDDAVANQTPAAIDNVTLRTTCTMVSNISATVNEHTAVVTWDYPEGQNAWTMQYKPMGSDAWQSVNTTSPSVTLSNLATETTYDVRVRSNCETESSAWAVGQFTVPCITLTSSELEITIGTGTSTSSTTPMNAYYGNSWTQMIYPASNFETPGFINSLSWNVSSANAHDYTSLKIYLGTTTMSAHTGNGDWLPMEDLTLVYESNGGTIGTAAGWETYTMSTPYYYNAEENLVVVVSRAAPSWKSLNYYYTSSSNSCLYRRADGNASYAEHPGTATGTRVGNLPNMIVDYTGYVCGDDHCAAPAGLTVDNVTTNSANLTWEAGDATAWRVSYKGENDEEWTVLNVSTNYCALTGLEQNADYEVRVIAECGILGTSDEAVTAFTTMANCPAPTNLAVTHHSDNTTVTWTPVPGVNTYELQYDMEGSVFWQSVTLNNVSSFVIGGLTEDATYNVRVRSVCDAETNETSEWAKYTFIRPAYCNVPSEVTVTEITGSSAKVTWDAQHATSWTVQYGVTGFTLGMGTQQVVNAANIVLTGLNAQTTYDVYVKANCGYYTSVWTPVTSFTTDCGALTITEANPWTDNFEGYTGSGVVGVGQCWARPVTASASNGTFPSVYVGYSGSTYSGSNSIEFKGASNMLVLPAFTNAMNTLEFSFWANTTAYDASSAGTMELGVITNVEDPTTFTLVAEIPATAFNRTGQDAPHANFVGPISFANVTPEAGQRIAFRYSNPSSPTQSWNLDDFIVSIIQPCPVPSDLEVSNITVNSADLTWTSSEAGTAWQLQYGVSGFTVGLGTVVATDSTHYSLTGLSEGTTYDVYVKSLCGDDLASAWAGPFSFTTDVTPGPEPLCESGCEYTFVLTDTYGNGWTDMNMATEEVYHGSLVIRQNGQLVSMLSMVAEQGETATYYVTLCDTMQTTLSLIPCYWADEMGVAVYNPDNELVWQFVPGTYGGFGDDTTVTFSFLSSCPAPCDLPTNLLVTNLTDTTATLTWNGEATNTYLLYHGPLAEDASLLAVDTVIGTEVTLTNLVPNITYTAYVRALCDKHGNYTNVVTFFPTEFEIACNGLTIGNEGRIEYYMPVDNYYKNSYSQQIFLASEIGVSGTIDKISFDYAYATDMTKKNNVKIYLGHTDKTVFANGNDWISEGLLKVYEGSLNCTEGWNEFVLDTVFNYNGLDNLVVVVEDNSNDYDGSSYKFYQTNTTDNMAMTWHSDSYTWSNQSGTLRNYRSTIRFNVCSSVKDLAVTSVSPVPSTCDLSRVTVAATIQNKGIDVMVSDTINLYYSVNGGEAVHEVLITSLNNGMSATYTFNTFANLTDPSNVITVWVEMNGDGNVTNNMAYSNVVTASEPATVPFVETFNDGEIHDGWVTYYETYHNNAWVEDVMSSMLVSISDGMLNISESDAWNEKLYTMSPCMYIPAGRYDVSYLYKVEDPMVTESFKVYLCTKGDNGFNILQEVSSEEFDNNIFVRSDNFIDVAESGIYYFAIRSFSPAQHIGFSIDNFAVNGVVNFTAYYAEHGSGIPEGQIEAPMGEPYTLTIIPDPGYHVAAIYKNMQQVSGENLDNATVQFFTFVPHAGDNIYVTFTNSKFMVTATCSNLYETSYADGQVGALYSPDSDMVAFGGSHTGIITLAEHYHLCSVTVNGLDVTSNLIPVTANKYMLTLNNIMEDKHIHVLAGLDSATIVYTVLAGEGTINGVFDVDATTPLPAVYTVTLPGYSDLLSTITPAPGYHVASIVVDGVEHSVIEMFSFEHLFDYHTVEVIFAKDHYTITTAAFGNGAVSAGVEFDYDPDFEYVFTATPAVGYRIGSILRNNVELVVLNPSVEYTETLVNITSDYHYAVQFVQDVFTVTATSGNNGTISPAGISTYYYNQDAVYEINAAPGYYISSLTIDGETTSYTQSDAVTSITHTFAQISENHIISATFAQLMYNVTVNAGPNGSITPGTGSFAYGTTPTFLITPNEGFAISDVIVDNASVGAVTSYTFTALTADHIISAVFVAQQFAITATAGNGGSITPAGVTSMAYNGSQTYTITPNTGYHISDVFVDGVSVGAVSTYSFNNVTANHIIFAAFEANEYTITVNQPANGVITPGTTTVLSGATPAFVITPSLGYTVSAITVNGTNVISSATHVNDVYTYVFPAVTANQTITASMTAKTFTINATAGANGSITPNGNTTVYYGNTQAYTITPANGYVVDNVTVDGMSMGALNSYIFTNVVANHTISVTFRMADCDIPTFLYTSHIDSTSAELHWSHPTATSFDIQYKTPTGTYSSVAAVSGTSYLLTGLTPNTTYLWQIRANCTANNHSEWTNLVSFTTDNVTIDETGIEDYLKNHIKVYAEHQNVHILNNEGMNIENVRIFDAYGKLIYSGKVYSAHEVINLNVAAGTYIVNVNTENGVANYKVTILK